MLSHIVLFSLFALAAAVDSITTSSDNEDIWKVQVGTSSIGRIKYEDGEVILYSNQGKPTDIFFTPFPHIDPSTSQCHENILSGHVELSLSVQLYTPQLIQSVHAYLKQNFKKLCVENGTCDVSLLPMNAIRLVQKGRRTSTTRQMYTINDEWHSNTLLLQEIKFVIYAANDSVCQNLLSSIAKRCYLSNFEIHYALHSEKAVERQVEISTNQVTETAMFNQIQSQFPQSDSVGLTGGDFKQLVSEIIDKVTMKLRIQEGFDSQIQDPVSLDKLLERQLQFKQIHLRKVDDQLWESLYWTPELTRPDRLAKLVNKIFRKKSADSKNYIYDRKAVKNVGKLDLTQHDIDRLEQLDKQLANYVRSSKLSNSYQSSSSGKGEIDFGPFKFGGESSDTDSSKHNQANNLQTMNDTTYNKKIHNNYLNVTKTETDNETQYELTKDNVEAYLNELSDHIHLEGEIIRPKPIDAHLIKLNKIRIETKLFSHSVFVRTRKNVHVLPLRCPSTNNKFNNNSVTNQHPLLVDKVDQLTETVNNLTNQVSELKKQLSEQVIQVENSSNKVKGLSSQLTQLENNSKQERSQLSSEINTLKRLVTQISNKQDISVSQSYKFTQLEEEIEALESRTKAKNNELVAQITVLERKITSTANAETVQQQLNKITNDLAHVRGRTVYACRVCFMETEGSSQCGGSRNSCSNWSTSADWTHAFRDDTDGRGGGCTYHWKVECLTGV